MSPLGFFSQTLLSTEQRYSVIDQELLVAYAAICHFRLSIKGRRYSLFTNHHPLAQLVHQAADTWTAS